MSQVTEQSLEQSNTANSFISSLATNAALLAVQLVAFTLLKGKLRNVYAPRTFLPPQAKRAESLPRGPWKWMVALATTDPKDILKKNGLDAYLFIRYLKLLMRIFGLFTLITWPVLLVVDSVHLPQDPARDGLSRLTWGNVPSNQQHRYAAHIILIYLLTFFVIWLIRRELDKFVHLRHQFLISHSHSKLALSRTVLITDLPDEIQADRDLHRMLSFVPGGIQKIWIYRKTGSLPDWWKQRLNACKKLEAAECDLLRAATKAKRAEVKARQDAQEKEAKEIENVERHDPVDANGISREIHQDVEKGEERATATAFGKVKRPTHRTGKLPFTGPTVDSITYWKDEILRLTQLIDGARKNLEHDASLGAAFIQCNLQLGAHVLSQVVLSDQPLRMYDKWTDVAPRDIVWENIDDSGYEVRARFVTSWLAQLGLIVLWAFPVSFIGLLSNLDNLCLKVHWLAWVCRLPKIPQGIISGVLPPVLLAVLFIILPIILRALAWYENIPRNSLISLSVYKRYYIFLIIHGFLIVTLSSGLTAAIPQILARPSSAVESLSMRLPDASTFFLTYVTTIGLTGAASALLQTVALAMYFLNRWLLGDTPRDAYKKTRVMPAADFGVIMPRFSLIATIAVAYSVISPIINGLALLSFFLLWFAYKYLFTWVYDQPEWIETGGLYFPLALENIFVGLYIEQICVCGLFFLNTTANKTTSITMGVLMLVLIAITFTAQVFFILTYRPLIQNLPTTLSTKKIQARWERQQKGEHEDFTADLFSRERVSKLVRRKLKIGSPVVDAHAIIAQEKRKEEEKSEQKDKTVKENAGDLARLTAVLGDKISTGVSSALAPEAVASGSRGASSLKPAVDGSSIKRPGSVASSTRKSQKRRGSEEGPSIQTGIRQGTQDDSDSDDDDIEDNAFDHPSTYEKTPVIWIPRDDLGLSTILVAELQKSGVDASDEFASMDPSGNVDVQRSPPDEPWFGGQDI